MRNAAETMFPVEQAQARRDAISLERCGLPYPAAEYRDGRLLGCLIRNRDLSDLVIVYFLDTPLWPRAASSNRILLFR